MIIQRLSELWRRIDKHSENFNKELETIKNFIINLKQEILRKHLEKGAIFY